jgi:hypothetical protein
MKVSAASNHDDKHDDDCGFHGLARTFIDRERTGVVK